MAFKTTTQHMGGKSEIEIIFQASMKSFFLIFILFFLNVAYRSMMSLMMQENICRPSGSCKATGERPEKENK